MLRLFLGLGILQLPRNYSLLGHLLTLLWRIGVVLLWRSYGTAGMVTFEGRRIVRR